MRKSFFLFMLRGGVRIKRETPTKIHWVRHLGKNHLVQVWIHHNHVLLSFHRLLLTTIIAGNLFSFLFCWILFFLIKSTKFWRSVGLFLSEVSGERFDLKEKNKFTWAETTSIWKLYLAVTQATLSLRRSKTLKLHFSRLENYLYDESYTCEVRGVCIGCWF